MLKRKNSYIVGLSLVLAVWVMGLVSIDRVLVGRLLPLPEDQVTDVLEKTQFRLLHELDATIQALQTLNATVGLTAQKVVFFNRMAEAIVGGDKSLLQVSLYDFSNKPMTTVHHPPKTTMLPLPLPFKLEALRQQPALFASEGGGFQVIVPFSDAKKESNVLVVGRVNLESVLARTRVSGGASNILFALSYLNSSTEKPVQLWGDSRFYTLSYQSISSSLLPDTGQLVLSARYSGAPPAMPLVVWLWRAVMLLFTGLSSLIGFRYLQKARHARVMQGRLVSVFTHSPMAAVASFGRGQKLYVNHAFTGCFGYDSEEVRRFRKKGMHGSWLKHMIPDRQHVRLALEMWGDQKASTNEGASKPVEVCVRCKDGELKTALLSFVMLDKPAGREWMAIMVDVSGQREKALKLELYGQVFNNMQEAIIITDIEENVVDINPAYTSITGFSRQEVIGHKMPRTYTEDQDDTFFSSIRDALLGSGKWRGNYWTRRKSGDFFQRDMSVSTVYGENDEHGYYVSVFTDVTENSRQQKELELMKHYDPLTQLPNRVLFTDRFTQAAARSRRNDSLLAVCVFDLDEFKKTNRDYGEEIADQLLIAVANRICMSIREEDTLSRFGGDEFTLLLCDVDSAEACVQTLGRIQENLRYPYEIAGQTISTSASIGVTLYPQDDDDLDILLRHADQAMYQAKLTGRNNYCLFNRENDQRLIEQHDRLREMKSALENGEFCLYYQPKVNMTTGDVFGVEALIRWNHPERGVLPPGAFLPHVDSCPLEIEMGHWVMHEALRQMDLWLDVGIDLEVSINISSYHMQSGMFFTQLQEALSQHPRIKPRKLQIEVLESSTLADIASVSEIVAACHDELGVSIALDDFGTGYSSLIHIKELNADTIKIDQTFIRDMLEDPNDYAIADGVIRLADAFNRRVVAEGVEETEHGLMLMVMGCKYAQGYCIARPMPAIEVAGWLESYEPNPRWQEFPFGTLSASDSKIMIFRMSFSYWISLIEKQISDNVDLSESAFCEMRSGDCHCGVWLEHEKQGSLFANGWLSELEVSHQNVHLLANDIARLSANDAIDALQSKIGAFREASNTVLKLLDNPSAKSVPEAVAG